MSFSPQMAERRFGYGLSPHFSGPASASAMLKVLSGPDLIGQRLPQLGFRPLQDAIVTRRRFRGFARKNPDTEEGRIADAKQKVIYEQVEAQWFRALLRTLARRSETQDAFRERLVAFWGDHFTARGKFGMLRFASPAYLEEAVRPNITGTFADLLIACVKHPVMLHYLDQDSSAGPNSIIVRRRDLDRGLNENLAREVLELHTLGSDGPYTQEDVRQLAELFTGLTRARDFSFVFRRNIAEPGAETILGKTYGQGASLQYIEEALRDLAAHPATARHIARKLAVHFVSDTPPDELVAALEAAYRDSGGDLMALYEALLAHPVAWDTPATNIRPPQEFISAAVRGMGLGEADLERLDRGQVRRFFIRPLQVMGQPWHAPPGPDGWAEEDDAWITPQGISARLEWGIAAPSRLLDALPDPLEFLDRVVGDAADDRTRFGVGGGDNRNVGVGLVLVSPGFQRR